MLSRKSVYSTFALLLSFNIMSFEMLAIRSMTFYFGGSSQTISIVIAIVLLALTIGSYSAAKYQESPSINRLYLYLLNGSILYVVTSQILFKEEIFHFFINWLGHSYTGAILVASSLYLLPNLVWGQCIPLVINTLTCDKGANSKNITATIIAISTFGSVLGTLLATQLFLPWMGEMFFVLSMSIMTILLILFLRKSKITLINLVICIGISFLANAKDSKRVKSIHSSKNRIDIENTKDVLRISTSYKTDSFIYKNDILMNHWTLSYLVAGLNYKPKNILILGVAGGVNILQAKEVFPNAKITAVEIDPKIVEVTEKELGVSFSDFADMQYLDARVFLSQNEKQYDYIIMDIYQNGYLPEHCLTKEFFSYIRNSLSDSGILNINTNLPEFYFKTSLEKNNRPIRRLMSTLASTGLVNQYFNRISSQLIASKKPIIIKPKHFIKDLDVFAMANWLLTFEVTKEQQEYSPIIDNKGVSYTFGSDKLIYKHMKNVIPSKSNDQFMKISEKYWIGNNSLTIEDIWKDQSRYFRDKDQLRFFISKNDYVEFDEQLPAQEKLLKLYNNLIVAYRRGDLQRLQELVRKIVSLEVIS